VFAEVFEDRPREGSRLGVRECSFGARLTCRCDGRATTMLLVVADCVVLVAVVSVLFVGVVRPGHRARR
jgi:hypothetical protein